jgi:hypothetical protein
MYGGERGGGMPPRVQSGRHRSGPRFTQDDKEGSW